MARLHIHNYIQKEPYGVCEHPAAPRLWFTVGLRLQVAAVGRLPTAHKGATVHFTETCFEMILFSHEKSCSD